MTAEDQPQQQLLLLQQCGNERFCEATGVHLLPSLV
jgi:hypothetical protein